MSPGQIRVFVLLLILLAMEAILQPQIQAYFKSMSAAWARNKKAGSV